jgi:hypothetical protein
MCESEPLSNNALPGGETKSIGDQHFQLPPGRFRFTASSPRNIEPRAELVSDEIDLKAGKSAFILKVRKDKHGNSLLDVMIQDPATAVPPNQSL